MVLVFSISQGSFAYENNADFPAWSVDVHPTDDSFFMGVERTFLFEDKSFLQFDAKNTVENNEDFGRAGVSFRYAFSDSSVFSSRLETAWIEGFQNIGMKMAMDFPGFGLSITGVKSLSDSEIVDSQEFIISEDSELSSVLIDSQSDGDVFQQSLKSISTVLIEDTVIGTHDSVTIDLFFRFLDHWQLEVGGSYLEMDDWDGAEYHAGLICQLSDIETLGLQIVHKPEDDFYEDETEGGIFYKKRFSNLRDLFSRDGANPMAKTPLLKQLINIPFSTPPMKLMTVTELKVARVIIRESSQTNIIFVNDSGDSTIIESRIDSRDDEVIIPDLDLRDGREDPRDNPDIIRGGDNNGNDIKPDDSTGGRNDPRDINNTNDSTTDRIGSRTNTSDLRPV